MSRPREELHGRLSYRTEPRRSPHLSLFHLKLTDSALRSLLDFQRSQDSGCQLSRPVISFQGSQGYIKIPSASSTSEDGVRVFAFYLSRESKDKPQSSFDCIRQGLSRCGQNKLDCVGNIQDKITICATDESYQLTRDRVSQVEKETWSRSAIEIKPGAPYRGKCVKIPKKHGLESSEDGCTSIKRPHIFLTPAARKSHPALNNSEPRPLREWLLHLLALRPHQKLELLLRLERANVNLQDQAELQSVLEMVGRFSRKESSYTLKEELFSQVQKNWLGYTAEEKQHVAQILLRKQSNGVSTHTFQPPPPPLRKLQELPLKSTEVFQKCGAPSESRDRHTRKKQKALHLSAQATMDKRWPAPAIPSLHLTTETPKPPCSALVSHKGFVTQSQRQRNAVEQEDRRLKEVHRKPQDLPNQVYPSNKKPKRHKEQEEEEEQETSEEEEDDDWEEEAALRLERYLSYPEDKAQPTESPPSSAEMPDYFLKYGSITSVDQQQVYEEDFSADYTEYRNLHAKIGKVSERFMQLGSKMKKLKPGTAEHKVIEDKILAEYTKFKKTYPGYREEKRRCEYLHHKLSHIKRLIVEYEEKTMSL
ncbi:RNA polymerase II elongation factor ELL3 isoform X1 [Microcaecilia unicolor]|uniref:RNA polymerase II elongation factor ELL3 isoform X1 n=1 Tax=Microcaecilia unicolor TaxID=1415580 RepID=A0A6P7WQL9_9AMPH|nr:RNA polymerase II elongation factor ELL3 isoform X1 [Microcaecilia unicolor]